MGADDQELILASFLMQVIYRREDLLKIAGQLRTADPGVNVEVLKTEGTRTS